MSEPVPHMARRTCGLVVLLLCLASASARADDAETGGADPAAGPRLSFNGFGTVGLVHSSQSGADYTFDNLQPAGAGRSRDWSPDVDSRLGAQLTALWGPQWTAVLQVISEYRSDGSYSPYLNWANIKYAVTPDLSLRVGRIGMASFMASDSRRVGYANVTARPPTEVYRLLALKDSDGVDLVYRWQQGEFKNSATLLYGRKTVINTSGVHVHSHDVQGIFDTVEYRDWTFHVAYQTRDVDNQNPPLGRFMSLGVAYEPGDWFFSAEWARALNYSAKGVLAVREAWYLNGGLRLGAFTPFATLSQLSPLTSTGGTPVAQKTAAAGLRWDFAARRDLKLQLDHLWLGEGSWGTLQNIAPGTPKGGQLDVFSVVLDFVF